MKDILQAFQVNEGEYRGVLVHLESVYQQIIFMHDYPQAIAKLLGQALAAISLLGNNLKQAGKLSLQFTGEDSLRLLLTEINHHNEIRGVVKWQEDKIFTADNVLPAGQIALTMTPEHGERYQGVVPTIAGSLALSFESYFSQSEQLYTKVLLVSDDKQAAGLLLQKMPEKEGDLKLSIDEANFLLATVKDEELIKDMHKTFLKKIFHEHDVRIFDAQHIQFKCTCNIEKMANAVKMLGHEEAESVLSTYQYIEVTCDFCNHHYQFDPVEVAKIFAEDK